MKHLRRALWLFGGLTAVALLFASQLYVYYRTLPDPVPFKTLLALQIGHWYVWALAGPFAWAVALRWPIRAGQKLRRAVLHVVMAIAVAIAVDFVYADIYYVMVRLPVIGSWFSAVDRARGMGDIVTFLFSVYFHTELLVYGAVVAVAHAVRSSDELRVRERDALQLSSELATARLQVLTAQLQPHFLFNTLHTIGSLILQRKNEHAMQILAELGELLRITLNRQTAEAIPLSDELDHLMRYLKIEETRFGDRLTVQWEVDPAALDARLPPLLLQPLVENSLKHGVSTRIEAAALTVRATTTGGRLRVSVHNDGPLLPPGWSLESSAGFGLRNVRERLLTRGADSTLRVENEGQRGVVATIDLPLVVLARKVPALV